MNFDPIQALNDLKAGNERFVREIREGDTRASAARRLELVAGQRPFAVVVSCADSRVPPELVFDAGLGDLFVIRVAGQVLDPAVEGSVEYALTALGTRLVVVMGHLGCGAVKATLDMLDGALGDASPNVLDIVDRVRPAVESVLADGSVDDGSGAPSLVDRCVHANVHAGVSGLLHGGGVVAQHAQVGRIMVVGAVYDLRTGRVDFVETPKVPVDG